MYKKRVWLRKDAHRTQLKTISSVGKYFVCEIVVVVDEKSRIVYVECGAMGRGNSSTM